ncbi:hypothetical protein AAFF_G00347730 [Aldrovandia affinis]|uniref:Uncharacterized protein n=1 Tax=Aldrovandia affinis TaxID=143900 RepID=A0AAD7WP63_9TELE|nr:hypothetical protein AAFF_G00347730 [Aldrovandia affinis]
MDQTGLWGTGSQMPSGRGALPAQVCGRAGAARGHRSGASGRGVDLRPRTAEQGARDAGAFSSALCNPLILNFLSSSIWALTPRTCRMGGGLKTRFHGYDAAPFCICTCALTQAASPMLSHISRQRQASEFRYADDTTGGVNNAAQS